MLFEVLGPLRVWDGSRQLIINPRSQRVLLARLLCAPGRPVPIDRLIDAIWGSTPPRTAGKNLQVYVYQLRRVLGRDRLILHPHGYSIMVGPGELDADQFERLAAAGARAMNAGDVAGARDRMDAALELWRGPAFAELATADGVAECAYRLTEQRLMAVEARFDVDLRLGRAAEVVADAGALVREYPLRERLRGQYMVALFRCGRQAEALQAYQDGREVLADELGVDATKALQRIHIAILRGEDPGPPLYEPAGPEPADEQQPVLPRQLPADVAGFVGREVEMAALDALVDDRTPSRHGVAGAGEVRIVVVDGMAGVGKTSLAVHWAHRIAHRFPDGQLYLQLRGYHSAQPMPSQEALAVLLRSLNVQPDRLPQDVEEMAGLYRSLLSGRRVLIVLDNVRTAEQIRPLIPSGSGSVVLVTSRDRLGGLAAREGASHLTLDVLSAADARSLLAAIVGHGRLAAEAASAARVAELCAYLPLALRIAAAQIVDGGHDSLESYVEGLVDDDRLGRLAINGDEGSAVRRTFDLSYRALRPADQRLFRLLGVVPGADLPLGAVAAIADLPPAEVRSAVDRLVGAHVVGRHSPDRFTLHDLLRVYAREHAAADPGAEAARVRLYAWYQDAVNVCTRRAYPHVVSFEPAVAEPVGVSAGDALEALAWLEAEFTNIVLTICQADPGQPPPAVWRLAFGIRGYMFKRGRSDDLLRVSTAATVAAEADGSPLSLACAHLLSASVYREVGRTPEAFEELQLAHLASRGCDWPQLELAIMANMAGCAFEAGSLHVAADLMEEVVRRKKAMDEWTLPTSLVVLAVTLLALGREDEALAAAQEAFDRSAEANPAELANTLHGLGRVCAVLGRFDEAVHHLQRAIGIQRDLGDANRVAWYLAQLSAVYLGARQVEQAVRMAEEALALTGDRESPLSFADILNAAAASRRYVGDLGESMLLAQRAHDIAHSAGLMEQKIAALVNLAAALDRGGAAEAALSHLQRAHELAEKAGYVRLDRVALAMAESIKDSSATRF